MPNIAVDNNIFIDKMYLQIFEEHVNPYDSSVKDIKSQFRQTKSKFLQYYCRS